MHSQAESPAELAARDAISKVLGALDDRKSFLLEAGAGAGKTYSLVCALRYLLANRRLELARNSQRIACITYTNVARDEIEARTDRDPLVFSSTIHSFCWSIIKDFQPQLRQELARNSNWTDRLTECGGVGNRVVDYDLGYPAVEGDRILLGHDDVPKLAVSLMALPKFRALVTSRFPFLFVDEYQDTDKGFADAIASHFLGTEPKITVGFFGDHWQKIYPSGCGKLEHPGLVVIGKHANFRSAKLIVDSLNIMRPELTQEVSDQEGTGTVDVFHTNSWPVSRRAGGHWGDDLQPDDAHAALTQVTTILRGQGWDVSPEKTKILMLTHNVLAEEQGYKNLAKVFSHTESFIKKEDSVIEYLVDFLEPLCEAFVNRKYGEFFTLLGAKKGGVKAAPQKREISDEVTALLAVRETGTIGDVIDYINNAKWVKASEKLRLREVALASVAEITDEQMLKRVDRYKNLRDVSYREVRALAQFINEKTPFSTKHGVKGAEFENVLVVLGRGWNHYNFGQMLEWMDVGVPGDKQDAFVRNRNLFYVACSRPRKRLALLFTQKLTTSAVNTLVRLFGQASIRELTYGSIGAS